jgi:hypothetical protein
MIVLAFSKAGLNLSPYFEVVEKGSDPGSNPGRGVVPLWYFNEDAFVLKI